MQGAVFKGGGDYAGNKFVIGSGPAALLCRYQSGRRTLDATDQMTLEWAGAYRRYHAAMMPKNACTLRRLKLWKSVSLRCVPTNLLARFF